MGNTVLIVMKKGCQRIIKDQKLFFSAVIMPGLLIFLMYTLMGTFMSGMMHVDEDYQYQVHVVNMPASAEMLLGHPELRIDINHISDAQVDGIRQQIEDRETDLLLIFPVGFDETVATFDPATATEFAPNVQVWANTTRPQSHEARAIVTEILNAYHHALTHRFSINAPSEAAPEGIYDLATEADMFAMVLGMLVPLLFLMFIYSGSMTIAPESISGEKERGTLGVLLVTPADRRAIAFGKILSIAIFALLGAVGSIIGMTISMPAMLGITFGELTAFYSIVDLLLLFAVAASTTLVFVALLSVLSAYAKSVKEATAYATPFMLVAMICGLASTFLGGVPTEAFFYFIPIFNSSLSISSIISFEVNVVNMAITSGVNIVFSLICAWVLGWIFSSEKIVFS